MTIFFAVLAAILLWGMIGDKERENRKNFTLGFVVTVMSITVLEILKLF